MINLKEQLLKYGYFSEHVPPLFSTEVFSNYYDDLLNTGHKNSCECVSFTMPKNDSSRRSIKIPNPAKQIKLIEYLISEQSWLERLFDENIHSLSNPFYDLGEMYDNTLVLDIPGFRDEHPRLVKSTYIKNLKSKMDKSLGYKYCYKLDLANFYDNIYTHALEWAVVGREQAQREARDRSVKHRGRSLDELIRYTNSNETSGIPTGPFTSRIISEVLLKKISEELEDLSNHIEIDFKFIHYVDDFEFYFRNESDFHKIKNKITEVFESYRLRINENKTKLIKYPYHTIRDIKREFEYYFDKYDSSPDEHTLRLLFFKADELTELGELGAYKYLYKMLIQKDSLVQNWSAIEPFLIGHLLIKPSISQYIVELIILQQERSQYNLDLGKLKNELFINLNISLDSHLHNESQWLLWALIKLDYEFTENNLEELYKKCDDDVTKIMIIHTIYRLQKQECENLIQLLEMEVNSLKNLEFESSRWLIAHEWHMNEWLNHNELLVLYNGENNRGSENGRQGNAFFSEMKSKNISFLSQ